TRFSRDWSSDVVLFRSSLDGGGMRGAYTATYLDRVAHAFARQRGAERLDIGGAFDLIVGTSTGGIIGCALAANVPLDQVVDLYRSEEPRVGKTVSWSSA